MPEKICVATVVANLKDAEDKTCTEILLKRHMPDPDCYHRKNALHLLCKDARTVADLASKMDLHSVAEDARRWLNYGNNLPKKR
jgi:hypothetical protein